MSLTKDDIFTEAMKLPADVRTELAEQLLATIDPAERDAIASEWADEIERRIDAYESGRIGAIPAVDVFRKLGLDDTEQ